MKSFVLYFPIFWLLTSCMSPSQVADYRRSEVKYLGSKYLVKKSCFIAISESGGYWTLPAGDIGGDVNSPPSIKQYYSSAVSGDKSSIFGVLKKGQVVVLKELKQFRSFESGVNFSWIGCAEVDRPHAGKSEFLCFEMIGYFMNLHDPVASCNTNILEVIEN